MFLESWNKTDNEGRHWHFFNSYQFFCCLLQMHKGSVACCSKACGNAWETAVCFHRTHTIVNSNSVALPLLHF